jgi:hypothetical protein
MPRNRMMGTRSAITAAAMLGVMVVAACQGENLFSVPGGPGGSGNDHEAPRVTITSPRADSLSAKPLGDSIFVQVDLRDNVGVASVRLFGVSLRGDASLGTDQVVPRFIEKTVTLPAATRDTIIERYLQAAPDTVKETAYIVAEATDAGGNVSTDTVAVVLGGPDVQLLDLEDGQSIQAGLNLSLRARAQDPLGLLLMRVELRGAFEKTVTKSFATPTDSAVLDTVLAVPSGLEGTITVTALARNTLDVLGQDGPITLNVSSMSVGDTIAPKLKHKTTTTSVDRMEVQDRLRIEVTGSDNAQGNGVAEVGYTVLAISPSRGDTAVRTGSQPYSPPRTGTLTQAFEVPVFNVDSLSLPDTLTFEVSTWMRDSGGNCAASVGGDTLRALPCGTYAGGTIAQGRTGERLTRTIVAGKTVALPTGGDILDAAVDTTRKRLFLSNFSTNRLEVFNLTSESFETAIGVGSEPWGLAVTRDGQSMWVANSGGTNLSKVDLATRREIDNERFLTPDVVLFDVELRTGDAGVQYLITPIPQTRSPSFSDRPQYVAVDSFGNLIYSTKTTTVGDLGTARKGFFEPGWDRTETKIFVEHGNFAPQENFWAIAHIDSITSTVDTLSVDSAGVATVSAVLGLFDHVPGFPNDIVKGLARSDVFDAVTEAAADLVTQGSDIYIVPGSRWDVESILFRDTTYVAASGDGGWVAIGEGGADPVGRVLTYQARPGEETSLSRWIQVSDLLTNPSEEVRGIGLNYDGTLGVVRGHFAAYFISPPDLRLQGVTEIPLASGGSGATLHPLHANARTLDNFGGEYRPDTHLAFVASGQRTIDIIDTQRFTRIGRVFIRDNITGPLRAVLPFPEDNAGFTCATIPITDKRGAHVGNAVKLYDAGDFDAPIGPNGETDDRCVVVKLFGTSEGGGVVVIDVRKADVLNEHPARE